MDLRRAVKSELPPVRLQSLARLLLLGFAFVVGAVVLGISMPESWREYYVPFVVPLGIFGAVLLLLYRGQPTAGDSFIFNRKRIEYVIPGRGGGVLREFPNGGYIEVRRDKKTVRFRQGARGRILDFPRYYSKGRHRYEIVLKRGYLELEALSRTTV
jgi:hypothetical protein